MEVEYRLKMGQDEFLLKVDVANTIEFFEKLSFYSNLPKVGPNGETDLKITHRTTTQGYNYYSLVSAQAGMEYKFGQPKDNPTNMYGKDWTPLYQGDNQEEQQSAPAPARQAAPARVAAPPRQALPPRSAAPTPVTAQPAQQTPAPAAASPQVQALASNVLSRFQVKQS